MKYNILIDIEVSYLNIDRFRRGFADRCEYKPIDDTIFTIIKEKYIFKEIYVLILDEDNNKIGSIQDLEMFVEWFEMFHKSVNNIIAYNVFFDIYILNYIFTDYQINQELIDYLNNDIKHVCLMSKQNDKYLRMYSLETYYNRLFKTNKQQTHTAKIDVKLAYAIYIHLLKYNPDMILRKNIQWLN